MSIRIPWKYGFIQWTYIYFCTRKIPDLGYDCSTELESYIQIKMQLFWAYRTVHLLGTVHYGWCHWNIQQMTKIVGPGSSKTMTTVHGHVVYSCIQCICQCQPKWQCVRLILKYPAGTLARYSEFIHDFRHTFSVSVGSNGCTSFKDCARSFCVRNFNISGANCRNNCGGVGEAEVCCWGATAAWRMGLKKAPCNMRNVNWTAFREQNLCLKIPIISFRLCSNLACSFLGHVWMWYALPTTGTFGFCSVNRRFYKPMSSRFPWCSLCAVQLQSDITHSRSAAEKLSHGWGHEYVISLANAWNDVT